MKIAAISDIHYQSGHKIEHLQRSCLNDAISVFQQEKPDLIYAGGDLAGLDSPHKYTPMELNTLFDFFKQCSRIAPVVICRGNHDASLQISIFSYIDNVYAFEAGVYCKQIEVNSVTYNLVFLPWSPVRSYDPMMNGSKTELNAAAILSIEKFIGDMENVIVFGHQPIRGVKSSGFIVDSPRDLVIPIELFDNPNILMGIFGHIHKHQIVSDKVSYVGSLFPVSIDEEPEDGGVTIYEVGKNPRRIKIQKWKHARASGVWNGSNWESLKVDPISSDDNTLLSVKVKKPLHIPCSAVPVSEILYKPMSLGAILHGVKIESYCEKKNETFTFGSLDMDVMLLDNLGSDDNLQEYYTSALERL